MMKPFTKLGRTCASGLTKLVGEVRVISYNRMIRRERNRIDYAQASFVAIPRLVTTNGPMLPLSVQARKRK